MLEYRYAEGKQERLPDLATELVRRNVDLIFTYGDHQIRAAKQATQTIPIVVGLAGDLLVYQVRAQVSLRQSAWLCE